MNTRRSFSFCAALGLSVLLVSCGGSSGTSDPGWAVSTSAQSRALSSPGAAAVGDSGHTLTLVGGNGTNSGCPGAQYGFGSGPCTVTASLLAPRASYSFDWSYTTGDNSGPGADLFGVVVDGQVVPLSDPGGPQQQSGKVTVTPATSLSFFLNCTDCTDGNAQATVSSFIAR